MTLSNGMSNIVYPIIEDLKKYNLYGRSKNCYLKCLQLLNIHIFKKPTVCMYCTFRQSITLNTLLYKLWPITRFELDTSQIKECQQAINMHFMKKPVGLAKCVIN